MWHIGIDLHRKMLVMAAVNDNGEVVDPVRIDCQDTAAIVTAVERLKPFRAVVEATGTYRWLYDFPQVEALLDIHGIGVFFALVIIAELGEVDRFRTAKQVGAYAGLTSRVHQSGSHCYHGSITHQGSPWLRWVF